MLVIGLDVTVRVGDRARARVTIKVRVSTPKVRNASLRRKYGTKCLETAVFTLGKWRIHRHKFT